eukprot:12934306-Prorocentrum_lima.AAC.1
MDDGRDDHGFATPCQGIHTEQTTGRPVKLIAAFQLLLGKRDALCLLKRADHPIEKWPCNTFATGAL